MTKSEIFFYKKYFIPSIKHIKAHAEKNSTCDQERIRICSEMLYPFFKQHEATPYLLEYLNKLDKKLYTRSTFKDSFFVGGISGMIFSRFDFFALHQIATAILFIVVFAASYPFFSHITFIARGNDFLIEDWERKALAAILMSKTKHPMP